MPMITCIRASVAALGCVGTVCLARADAWPPVQAPPGTQIQRVADDMILNGKRSRLYRFEFKGTEEEVLRFYQSRFGPRRVENQIRGAHIVATQQGTYFHTVRLRAAGSRQVEVTIMTTALRADEGHSARSIDAQALMPPATTLLSTLQSQDEAKRSLLSLGANANSIRANRDHVVAMLQSRGFQLRSEEAGTARGQQSIVLVLASAGEEVDVTIADFGVYRSLVINHTWEGK